MVEEEGIMLGRLDFSFRNDCGFMTIAEPPEREGERETERQREKREEKKNGARRRSKGREAEGNTCVCE